MARIKCEMCGGKFEDPTGKTVISCEYCGITKRVTKNGEVYTVVDNITGKPVDMRQYTIELSDSTVEKLNELHRTQQEHKVEEVHKTAPASATKTRPYTVVDNITGKPVDMSQYTIELSDSTVERLNELRKK